MDKPTVSVCMIAYNHGAYIAEAIAGVLMQKTNFTVEVVISNDASSDNTQNIINELAVDTKTIKFRVFDHTDNLGMMPNFIFTLKACRGKYIALCEGDDYWTDPLKVQKQVDFLEANPEYSICFHEAEVLWSQKENAQPIELNSQFRWNKMSVNKSDYTIADVLNGPFMATASVVYRNPYIEKYPKWFLKAASGDITLYALITGDQKIKFMNEVMCVYRRNPGGVTRFHKGNGIILNRLQTLKHINSYHNNKYLPLVRTSVSNYLGEIKSMKLQEYLILLRLYLTSDIVERKYLISFFKKGLKKLI
tara:strand:+ start:84087 stop:85004 length:918 start_codon:yes stop_codon:yes gene_type:complete